MHADVVLGERSRVGMGCFAVPGPEESLITHDVIEARRMLSTIDFFGHAFGVSGQDQRESTGWRSTRSAARSSASRTSPSATSVAPPGICISIARPAPAPDLRYRFID